MASSTTAAREPEQGRRWVYGPASDLLLGCGVAYALAAALHGVLGDELSAWVPGGLLVLAFAVPHYGATLVRVYERQADRAKYRFFALHASIAIALAFIVGLQSPLLGSLILTVYLTWSPWHYTGQNYGIFLMMLGRRGVPFSPGLKRWIYASFILSYALTFLAIHGVERSSSYAPISYDGTAYHLIPIGLPEGVAVPLMLGVAGAYIIALAVAVTGLLRVGSLRALGPSLALAGTQALWFSLPVLARLSGAVSQSPAALAIFSPYGFVWVAAAHSVQYLWITSYYATGSLAGESRSRFLIKAALAGYAIWTLPGVIFAPELLGSLPYDSGLALLVASVVNLHHFVLDGAIWKLRDGTIARVLLQGSSADPGASLAAPRLPLRQILWVAGAACIGLSLVSFWESEFGYGRALARGDLVRASDAVERFRWMGRDSPTKRAYLGRRLAKQGDYDAAAAQFERSLELRPSISGWIGMAQLREQQLRWSEAGDAYDEALALDPSMIEALKGAARVQLGLERPAQARDLLERALQIDPKRDDVRALLVRAKIAERRSEHPSGTP